MTEIKSDNSKNGLQSVLPAHRIYFFLKGKFSGQMEIDVECLRQEILREFPDVSEEDMEDGALLFAIKERFIEAPYPYSGTLFPLTTKRVLIPKIFPKNR